MVLITEFDKFDNVKLKKNKLSNECYKKGELKVNALVFPESL